MSYSFYKPELVPDVFKLQNIGVICWCNSLIQALLSCSALNAILLDNRGDFDGNSFAEEYLRLLACVLPNTPQCPKINPDDYSGASAKIMMQFVKRLKEKNISLRFNSQECADEALVMFLDMFGSVKVDNVFKNSYETVIICKECGDVLRAPRDNSVQIEMFTNTPLKTEGAFQDYIRVHPSVVDSYKCEKCGTVSKNVMRVEKLKMLREVIVLVFNKYYDKSLIWFPEILSFRATSGKDLKYKIVAQIEHAGSRFGGHYYANVLRGDVHRANDTSIAKMSGFQPTAETYMVFYHLYEEA